MHKGSDKIEGAFTGLYLIGVYGSTSATFKIEIDVIEHRLKYLKPASPFETSQVAEAYYIFYNRVNKPIQISFTLHLGSFLVFIRTRDKGTADPETSVIDYLPTAQEYDW